MNRFLRRSTARVLSPVLTALMITALLTSAVAQATPYVLSIVEQGQDVVATGSGEFDLTGLRCCAYSPNGYGMVPDQAEIETGLDPLWYLKVYFGIVGPASFGIGNGLYANGMLALPTTRAGDNVGLSATAGVIALPVGYVSGDALWSSATWANASFDSLGLTPGVYTWTWGSVDITSAIYTRMRASEACQSFTVVIGSATGQGNGSCGGGIEVPEPTTISMFGLGMLLVGSFVGLRRRRQA